MYERVAALCALPLGLRILKIKIQGLKLEKKSCRVKVTQQIPADLNVYRKRIVKRKVRLRLESDVLCVLISLKTCDAAGIILKLRWGYR